MKKILIIPLTILFILFIAFIGPARAQANITFANEIKIEKLNAWGPAVYEDYCYVITYREELTVSKISLTSGEILENYTIEGIDEVMDLTYGDNSFWAIAYQWGESGHSFLLLRFNMDFEIIATRNISINTGYVYLSGLTYKDGYIWALLTNESVEYLAKVDQEGNVYTEYNLTELMNLTHSEYLIDVEFIDNEPVVLLENGAVRSIHGDLILNVTDYVSVASNANVSYWFTGFARYEDKLIVHYSYYNESDYTKSGSGFVIFNIQYPETPSGGIISEEDIPSIATTSAVSAAIATGASAVAVSASTGTSAATTVTVSGSITSVQTGAPQATGPGTGAPMGAPDLTSRLRSIAFKIAKKLSRLFKRKKKKEEEEEEFEKPSFLKVTIFLAILGAIVGGIIGFVLSKPITEMFSVLSSAIGLSLGAFGATIGTIIVYLYFRGAIIVRRITRKLALIASAVGGYYGVISSTLTLLTIAGLFGITALIILATISSLIGITVLGLSFQ